MKRIALALFWLAALPALAQYTTVTTSNLGGSSSKIANATIYWQPVTGPGGGPAAARVGTSGGQLSMPPVSGQVTTGVSSVSLPDSNASTPAICYAVTVIDNVSGSTLLGQGISADGIHVNTGGPYGCVQPTGTTWNFDTFIPGSTGAMGSPLLSYAGAWSSSTAYAVGTVVSYGGSSYTNTLAGNTNTPPGTGWSLLASIGASGIGTDPNCSTDSSGHLSCLKVTVGSTINLGVATYAGLQTAISACGSALGCSFHVNGTISPSSNLTLPAGAVLYFEGGSVSVPTGVTLNANGAMIVAPPIQIFAGSGTVTGLYNAEPEWFGSSATVATAAAALSTSVRGMVQLQPGSTYTSGTSSALTNAAGLNIYGGGTAQLASDYSHFLSGTGSIVKGKLSLNTSNVTLRGFAIDLGSTAGTCSDALDLTTAGIGNPVLKNLVIEDVATLLCSPTDTHHNILIENADTVSVRNVSVAQGTLGLVIKGSNVDVRGVKSYNNSSGGLYIKSDTTFGVAHDVNVNGYTASCASAGSCRGVTFEANQANPYRINLSNMSMSGVSFGVVFAGTGPGVTNDVSLSNFTVDSSGECAQIQLSNRVTLSNFRCNNNTLSGIGALDGISIASTATQTSIASALFTNTMQNAIYNNGQRTSLGEIECEGIPVGYACAKSDAVQTEAGHIFTNPGSGITLTSTANGGTFQFTVPATIPIVNAGIVAANQAVTAPTGSFSSTVTTPTLGTRWQLDGFTTANFPGAGQSQVGWSSGTYSLCQAVSYGGGNYLAVSASNNGVTPGTNSAIWYPVQNANTPTIADCGFYYVSAQVSPAQAQALELGNATYTTNIGWQLPNLNCASSNSLSMAGRGINATTIKQAATISVPTLWHPDSTTQGCLSVANLDGFTVQANKKAPKAAGLYAYGGGYWSNIQTGGAISGGDTGFEIGEGLDSTSGGWVHSITGRNLTTLGDLSGSSGGTAAYGSCTANGTGGIASCAVTGGGSNYTGTFTYVSIFVQGTATACNAVITPTVSSGVVTALIVSTTGTTCPTSSGNINIGILDIYPLNYGIHMTNVNDSTFYDLNPVGGQLAALRVDHSNNVFYNTHITSVLPVDMIDNANNTWIGTVCDTASHYCFDVEGTSQIIGTQHTWAYNEPGSGDFYIGASGVLKLTGDSCRTTQLGGGYFKIQDSAGVIYSGNASYPSTLYASQWQSCQGSAFQLPITSTTQSSTTAAPTFQCGGNNGGGACYFAAMGNRGMWGYYNTSNGAYIGGSSTHSLLFGANAASFGAGILGGYAYGGLPFGIIGSAIASASTIAPSSPVVHITGTTQITTITAPGDCTANAHGCQVTLIPDGLWTTGTGGNIAIASTAVVSKPLMLTYDPATSKWYPSY